MESDNWTVMLLSPNGEDSNGSTGYPAEFRRRVIELIDAGRKVSEVAADLGISGRNIYTWRRQERIDRGLEAGLSTA